MRPALLCFLCALTGCDRLFPYHTNDRGGNGAERGVRDQGRPRDGARPDQVPPWRTIADLGQPITACPAPWSFVSEIAGCESRARICGVEDPNGVTNASPVVFQPGGAYTQIRGRLRGRQRKSTDGFATSFADLGTATLDNAYVEGVSICLKGPGTRRHVWTFAVGLTQVGGGGSCPCTPGAYQPPSFIGSAWTCDSGNPNSSYWPDIWHPRSLWDAQAWLAGCVHPAPDAPWSFDVKLAEPTVDPVEVRILYDDCDERVGITELKIEVH